MDIMRLRKQADEGNAAAQTILGMCYLEGLEVAVDHSEAFRLLSEAARRGASRAIVYLASMYADGLGTSKDVNEAIRLYEVAANSGEFFAQIELARMFARGGAALQSDPALAVKWYSKALEQIDRVEDCDEIREANDYVAAHVPRPNKD